MCIVAVIGKRTFVYIYIVRLSVCIWDWRVPDLGFSDISNGSGLHTTEIHRAKYDYTHPMSVAESSELKTKEHGSPISFVTHLSLVRHCRSPPADSIG